MRISAEQPPKAKNMSKKLYALEIFDLFYYLWLRSAPQFDFWKKELTETYVDLIWV